MTHPRSDAETAATTTTSRPADRASDRRSREARGSRLGLAAAVLVAGLALTGCTSLASAPPVAESSATTSSTANRTVTSRDICRTARTLIDQGAPAEALALIDRYREGLPTPTPTPTRRSTATPTPTPTPSSPVLDCEPQRLAALAELGATLAPDETPAPSAAESFRADWDRVVDRGIAPFAPLIRLAVLGILLLTAAGLALAWARRRPTPFRGTTSSERLLFRDTGWRVLGGALIVAAPALFAATLALSSVLSVVAVVLGLFGVALVSTPPLRLSSDRVRLVVHPVSFVAAAGGSPMDPAAGVRLIDLVSRLIVEGRAPLDAERHVPGAPTDSARGGEGPVSAAAHIAGIALVPALPSDPGVGPARGRMRAAVDTDARVELWRSDDSTAVVFVDGSRRITAVADHRAALTSARAAGVEDLDEPGSEVEAEIVAVLEAAAVVEALSAAAGHRPPSGWGLALLLDRLAASAESAHALLRAAAAADPTALRPSGALLAQVDRTGMTPEQLADHLAEIRRHVDGAAVAGDAGLARAAGRADDSDLISEPASPRTAPPVVEPVPPAWEPWLADLLLAATMTAIDLEALTGRAADERTEADARRLVRLAASAEPAGNAGITRRPSSTDEIARPREASAANPTVLQMLVGVAFCELIPAERGSGSTVAGWASAALTHPDPEVAFAVARSFSLGWRDHLSADHKIEIERRIRDRLAFALQDSEVRGRVSEDAILRRHAAHPWFREFVARF